MNGQELVRLYCNTALDSYSRHAGPGGNPDLWSSKKLFFTVQCPCPTCSGLRSETLMSKMAVPVSLSPELALLPTKKTSDSGEV